MCVKIPTKSSKIQSCLLPKTILCKVQRLKYPTLAATMLRYLHTNFTRNSILMFPNHKITSIGRWNAMNSLRWKKDRTGKGLSSGWQEALPALALLSEPTNSQGCRKRRGGGCGAGTRSHGGLPPPPFVATGKFDGGEGGSGNCRRSAVGGVVAISEIVVAFDLILISI